jgi:DNA-binding MarR family transcriptional regulator
VNDRLHRTPAAAPTADDASLERLREADELGREAGLGSTDHAALRLWLRLLACTTQIEDQIRRRLRERFGISLSRFDFLAQLHRHPQGLRMRELSRHLMVTGGNVTGLTDQLEAEGLVARQDDPSDRRAWVLVLTADGRRQFEAMAAEHEAWVVDLMAGLDARAQQQLHDQLGALRVALVERR